MANTTLKFGNGNWAIKEDSALAYSDQYDNFKPLPFDFSRASSGTIVNKEGLIESVNSGLPRIDFSDSADGALLLEPQSTNLITYSSDFSDSSWIKNLTINENAAISPSGLLDATKITCTSNSYNYIFNNSAFSSGNYTNSIFLKKDVSSGWVVIRIWTGSGANGISVWFDLDNNQIGTSNSNIAGFTLIDATSKHLGNDWYRLSVSGTTNNVSRLTFNFVDGDGLNTYTNVSGKSCFIWGAQLENQSYATSYIPTQGSTSTRIAETCKNSGSAQDFNSEEGVLYAEISALANDGTYRRITISDGTSNNRINISYHPSSNYIQSFGFVNGVLQFVFTLQITPSTTSFNKIAVKFKENDAALWLNGVEIATDNSVNTWGNNTLNDLSFANNSSSNAEAFYGNVKALAVFKEALSDEELQKLTTI